MSDDQSPLNDRPHQTPATPADPNLRILDSTEILRGHREILIRHHDELYRLRLTRSDKLILHK